MPQKTPIQAINDLGINEGYIYIVDKTSDFIKTLYVNSKEGVNGARATAMADAPFSQSTRAVGIISITSVGATGAVTAVSTGGINQISANITFTGLTATQLATLLANGINSFDAGSTDFTARATNEVVTLFAKTPGSAMNGIAISITATDSGIVTTTIDTSGGFSSETDNSLYNNYFLDANYDGNSQVCGGTASSTAVGANAINITSVFVPTTSSGGTISETVTIDTDDKATTSRRSNLELIKLEAQSGSSDDLITIDTEGISDQDFLVLIRDGSDSITVKSTGNISLAGGPANMVLDEDFKSITLRYDVSSDKWIEVNRTSILTMTAADFRANSISIGLSGSKVHTILPAGGTTTLIPGTDAKDIVWDGNGVTLAGSAVLTFGGTPIDGEPYNIQFLPVADVGGNTVTIGGITLTEDQAETGVAAISFYDTANTMWRTKLLVDAATTFVRDEKIPSAEITAAKLENSGVSAGSYTLSSLTVNAQGLVTSATSGTPSSGTAMANILYVDANGNNTTAVKGDIAKPFETYDSAKAVASSGDVIVLMPGSYNTNDMLKDGVEIYFMPGASVNYIGGGDPIMKDDAALDFNCTISGYPSFYYNGTGTYRQSLYLTGTGTVNLNFKNAYFNGTHQKSILINNANATLIFKNCIFEQSVVDDMVIDIDTFSSIRFDDCEIINRMDGTSAHGLSINASDVIIDKGRIYIENATADCINATSVINMKLYSDTLTNKAIGGSAITQLIAYSIVVDTDFIL